MTLRGARVLPIIDVAACAERRVEPTRVVETVLARGVGAVLLRARAVPEGTFGELARAFVQQCRAAGAVSLVAPPDGVDAVASAAEAGAYGVHLRAGDVDDIADVHHAGLLAGLSAHDSAELEQAASAGADYVFLSPIRAPRSKPDDRAPLGWGGFGRLLPSAGTVPVYALGGLSSDDLEPALRAGAAGIAGITLAFDTSGADGSTH